MFFQLYSSRELTVFKGQGALHRVWGPEVFLQGIIRPQNTEDSCVGKRPIVGESPLTWNPRYGSTEPTPAGIEGGRENEEEGEGQRIKMGTRKGWKESKQGKGRRRPKTNNLTLCGH